MKRPFVLTITIALALSVPSGTALAATRYIVGSSPNLPANQRQPTYEQLSGFILKDLKPGDTLELYDALNLRQVASLNLPVDAALSSTTTGRLRHIASGLQQMRAFFAGTPPTGNGDGSIHEPQFLSMVGDQIKSPNEDLRVVLLGSPLYRDERQPQYGFDGGYYPSDAFLDADASTSPFSVRGHNKRLDGVPVYQACSGGSFTSNAHEAGVAHFWHLYVQQQSGSLVSYAADPAVVFERLRQGVRTAPTREEIDATQTKAVMIRRLADPKREDQQAAVPPRDPWIESSQVTVAPPLTEPVIQAMKLGVRWSEPVDVDIYAASQGNPDLYYGRNRTAEGIHVHDFVTAPPANSSTFEIIEFKNPVDIRKVNAAVNLYSGHATTRNGVTVEIRVWAGEGKVYSRTLRIPALEGNSGNNSAGRAHDPHWVVCDLPEICGLH